MTSVSRHSSPFTTSASAARLDTRYRPSRCPVLSQAPPSMSGRWHVRRPGCMRVHKSPRYRSGNMLIRLAISTVMVVVVTATTQASAHYFDGFENDPHTWETLPSTTPAARVASGTDGITSADGGYHAKSAAGNYTRWGGYNFGNGSGSSFQPYRTRVDIYLDVTTGATNDTRFDFSSAINNPLGNHRRDFILSGGFYDTTDNTDPGAGQNRFIFSASNNSPGWPKDPDRSPFAITQTGWYTLQHEFKNVGGVLSVDLSILDDAESVLNTWTLSDASDTINGTVGGNRYGWFSVNQFSFLAIDNAELTVIPEPASLALTAAGGLMMLRGRRRS